MDTQVLKNLERKLAVLNSVNCFVFKLLEHFSKKFKAKQRFHDPYSLVLWMRW